MDNLPALAEAALRDAGVASQASARALLAMWARLSLLSAEEREAVIRRFPFVPACDFGGQDTFPAGTVAMQVPSGPNTFGG